MDDFTAAQVGPCPPPHGGGPVRFERLHLQRVDVHGSDPSIEQAREAPTRRAARAQVLHSVTIAADFPPVPDLSRATA